MTEILFALIFDKIADGVLNLCHKKSLFPCSNCVSREMTTKMKGCNNDHARSCTPGKRFCIDFGFVCGKEIHQPQTNKDYIETNHQPKLTSKDGFNYCILDIDEYLHYLSVFYLLLNIHLLIPSHNFSTYMVSHLVPNGVH